ncbi:hypothetical protein DFH07DRAFT_958173 [Mycena maculata]|uniref:Uncharacterized protein n=1 Tax=Mycena maculata TaxID=230809 RepID=A0AAD7J7R2_9AGAR|nr:hypothetical protein DFH07DRAFT_958173 [Mycena maculata]
MTEYDYSPEAYHQHQRTQNRIAHWVDDTDHCAPLFKSPFIPRSDVQDNEFHHPRSGSASPRRHTPSPSHSQSSGHRGRRTPKRSVTYHTQPTQPQISLPLRSHTFSLVSPNDSISQVTGPSHRRMHRPHSSSPTRHSHTPRSQQHSGGGTYVISPGVISPGGRYPGVQYVQQPQPMYYMQQPAQPAAYIVHPKDRKVQIVYPEMQYPPVAHPVQEHHPSFLQRIFGSQSGKHGRSRSLSHSRSNSRSRW